MSSAVPPNVRDARFDEPMPETGRPLVEPRTGRRRLVSIFEVTGLEGDIVTGNEIWGIDPARDRLAWTGIRPRCLAKIAARGVAYALPPAVETGP